TCVVAELAVLLVLAVVAGGVEVAGVLWRGCATASVVGAGNVEEPAAGVLCCTGSRVMVVRPMPLRVGATATVAAPVVTAGLPALLGVVCAGELVTAPELERIGTSRRCTTVPSSVTGA